jgi:hypothetical protein
MTHFKQQFFLQFASLGLAELIANYRARYEPKKGDRFNVEGITYEIGPAKITASGIEFEISSKIPQEELASKADMQQYFEMVKAQMVQTGAAPLSIDMENIVREISEDETKERDYVKLHYAFPEHMLFTDDDVKAELMHHQADPAQHPLPVIPGVNTQAGRVVLSLLKQNLHQQARTVMNRLIQSNEDTRQKMRASGVGASL